MTVYGHGALAGAAGNGNYVMLYRRWESGPNPPSPPTYQSFTLRVYDAASGAIATYTGPSGVNAVSDLVDFINDDAADYDSTGAPYGYLTASFHSESQYWRGSLNIVNATEFTNGV